ncbi:MAG: hypothetical protein AAF363_12190 [Bacteroidota bacterium]
MLPNIIFQLSIYLLFNYQNDFLKDQKRYSRVRGAIAEKQEVIESNLNDFNLKIDNYHLLIIAYKVSDELELYAKRKEDIQYIKIKSYDICSRSGALGPKRKKGDLQVPKGFYHNDRFNPASRFHLSLGLNYLNLSDKRKRKFPDLGGDIFIHGACVTIGCLPMTDEKTKEIYLYAVYAKNNGQCKIPVYVFPYKMNKENMDKYLDMFKQNQELTNFWGNLKEGYDLFKRNQKELKITVSQEGKYLFEGDFKLSHPHLTFTDPNHFFTFLTFDFS